MSTTIGNYLLSRLAELGIRHLFGVPGDYNLQLLEQLKEVEALDFVGTCNELNAAYAADGYARLNGCGALLTTYGVGELSAICGVAGAAAEHVPMVCITGAPPLFAMESRLPLHHTLAKGDYDDMMACFRQFTVAQTRLTPENAASEIDRVLLACHRHKRPVYIQLPSNISYLSIDAPKTSLPLAQRSEPEQLVAAVRHIHSIWLAAERPAVLVSMDVDRLGIAALLGDLVEKTQTPYASLATGKCILDETSSLWAGQYAGSQSSEIARRCVEDSDCLLTVSPRFIEGNSGLFSHSLPRATTIELSGQSVRVGPVVYEGVRAADLLNSLITRLAVARQSDGMRHRRSAQQPEPRARLTQARLWPRMARFIQPDDVVLAESGTCNLGLMNEVLPSGVSYITANIWGAIGYTLPAILGTTLAAPARRHLLFIGDGSFQLTAQELSTLLRLELKPIIFLLNNRSYTIERFILGMEDSYNDVANWKYSELPGVFSDSGAYVTMSAGTEGELELALKEAGKNDRLCFIELNLDRFDAPQSLRTFGPATAEFDYGPRGPQRRALQPDAPRCADVPDVELDVQ